jgi:hypothetical protein
MEELITEKDIIMRGGAAAAPSPVNPLRDRPIVPQDYTVAGPDNILKLSLLQIVNDGMNDIVNQIKLKLGNNITSTNKNAKYIMDLLNSISTTITSNIGDIGDNTTIKVKTNADGIYDITSSANYYHPYTNSQNSVKPPEFTTNNPGKKIDMKTLDSNYNNYLDNNDITHIEANPDVINESDNFNLSDDNNKKRLENRLANCQLLEMLYMIKHEELMKTFAFTLNLFDKYKYAIKIMLFILKNLVKTTNVETPVAPGADATRSLGAAPEVNIKLPKTLIPNITKLLEDQEKVQEIITSMKETMDRNNDNIGIGTKTNEQKIADARLDDLSSPNIEPPSDTDINTEIQTTTQPQSL